MRIRSLHLTRGDRATLLGPLDLDLPPGGRMAVVGESGSGKSLLLKSILGALPPEVASRGSVQDVPSAAWVPQAVDCALHPFLPVSDQVSLLASVRLGLPFPQALRQALPWMERLGLPTTPTFLDRRPSRLSGGERQRIALVQALTARPRLLLLDEPTSALDSPLIRRVESAIGDADPELGWLWVTHDLDQARRVADGILVLYGGLPVERLAGDGPFRHPYSLRLLRASEGLPDTDGGYLDAPGTRGPGCPFAPRCRNAGTPCRQGFPPWTGTSETGQACWAQAGGAGGDQRFRPAALAR